MARKQHPRRTLAEIFGTSREIGPENTLLNDAEVGLVLGGSEPDALAAGTVANMRSTGRLNVPVVRVGIQPKARLSDVLAQLERWTERSNTGTARASRAARVAV